MRLELKLALIGAISKILIFMILFFLVQKLIDTQAQSHTDTDLMKMKEEELDKQRDKAENRKKAIQNALDKLSAKLAKQQAELQKCDQFLSAVNDTNLKEAA